MTIYQEAQTFLTRMYQEKQYSAEALKNRLQTVMQEIEATGTYTHTTEELESGAKMAWRNNNHCIGRLFWNTLQVVDAREADTLDKVKEYLFSHLEKATNNGRIKPYITIFKPDTVKIWNHQLIRYAGYRAGEEQIGDPHSNSFTELCLKLGWQAPKTDFDILPLLVQVDSKTPPKLIDIPQKLVKEVPMTHPDYPAFDALGLKWYAVPIISDMVLEIGGIIYQAAPFNGWYMETEIGARNFADEDRYNLLPQMADIMALDRKRTDTLWKDRALVELSVAVLHSFHQAKVQIVDHHTAAKQFGTFEEKELAAGRELTGNWAWLIPPVSPATTAIFHRRFDNTIKKPNFFYRKNGKNELKCPFPH